MFISLFLFSNFLNPWLSLYFISFPKFMRLWQSLPPVGLLIELASFNYVSKKKISQHSMFLFSKSLGQLWAKFWKCLFENCRTFFWTAFKLWFSPPFWHAKVTQRKKSKVIPPSNLFGCRCCTAEATSCAAQSPPSSS